MSFYLFVLCSCLAYDVPAQDSLSHFGISLAFDYGLPKNDLELSSKLVQEYQNHGANLRVFYQHSLNFLSNVSLHHEVGYRIIYSSGEIDQANFNVNTHKLLISEKLAFPVAGKFSSQLGFVLMNNLDFDEIRNYHHDVLRIDIEIGVVYALVSEIDCILRYSQGLSQVEDVYLLTNPRMNLSLGLQYKL